MGIEGTYATADVNQIISSAKAELKIGDGSEQDIWFGKLLNEGIRHLDSLDIFKKCVTRLDVSNNVAILPCGFFRLLALTIGDCACYNNAIYVSLPFIQSMGCNAASENGITSMLGAFEIQDDKIVFHNDLFFLGCNNEMEPEPITSCRIGYLGFNVDENGLLKVYQHMERALTAYICYKYARQNFREYPRDIREDFKQEWIAQKKWVKSISFQNDFRENRRQIAEFTNCLIADKLFLP